jgi:hypothetical protein
MSFDDETDEGGHYEVEHDDLCFASEMTDDCCA